MTYELCLKLKDAGFPQSPTKDTKIFYRSTYYSENGDAFFTLTQKEYDLSLAHRDTGSLASVKIPNLSELIEACGDDFFVLQKTKIKIEGVNPMEEWCAENMYLRSPKGVIRQYGNTPEEAVANLYLALNQK